MKATDIVLIEGARTPFTRFCGSFRDISAIDLATIASKEAITRSKVELGEIDHVVFGNVIQSSPDAVFFARHVGLKTGVPTHAPALTVNRLCGSGLESITSAARLILSGDSQVVLAGGAENMSQIPYVIRGARTGLKLGAAPMQDYLWEALYDSYGDCTMSGTGENVAVRYGITREEADEHAYNSHQKALRSMESGILQEEIVPVSVVDKKTTRLVVRDEHPRTDTTRETLAQLPTVFKQGGVITAGNASGINDGGAAVVITSADYAAKRNLKPIARLVSWSAVGVEPKYMGIGPVDAIRHALTKANMSLNDLDLIEINEAFSTQYLACQKELGFDPAIGNVNGGAVALGHPLGASGTRIVLALIYELKRRNKKFGATSVCIGGGQGIAAIWEIL